MDKNSPDLMKNITLQIKSVQQTSSSINTKRSTAIYIIVKLLKVKSQLITDMETTMEINTWLIRNNSGQKATLWHAKTVNQ